MICYQNYSLKEFHTFNINIKAKYIFIVKTIIELVKIWEKSQKLKLPFLILGKGSNVLFLRNFFGIIVINKIKGIKITSDSKKWYLNINSGEIWHDVVCFTLKNNFFGLENLAFIPGSAGAAPIQNIGAYGLELHQICNYVKILDFKKNKILHISAKECQFGYRDSIFLHFHKKNFAIISIGIYLKKKWNPILLHKDLIRLKSSYLTPQKIFHAIYKIRNKKIPNPNKFGNAGSFFKNPLINIKKFHRIKKKFPNLPQYKEKNGNIKLSAAWLIEKCNLKGYSFGGAKIFDNHALIIINYKKAKSREIVLLAKYIRKCVFKKFNIWLKKEIRYINCQKN